MNRVRILFRRGQEIKFISHLDLIRVWHRALRRANIDLAYSEGFNPHPKLSLAAPLPLGVTSEAELMDIYIMQPASASSITARLKTQLPTGLDILQAFVIPLQLPSLQAQVRFAEYVVRVPVASPEKVGHAIGALLALDSLPWQHQRDTGTKSYDLRRLIDDIRLLGSDPVETSLFMRLRHGVDGAGRPEQVIKALGLDSSIDIHRTKLILETA
jgi:radical SAM-linked protein